MGVQTFASVPAASAPVATLPAIVSPAMNGRMVIAAPFPGLVMRVYVLEGAKVRAGDALAVIFSQEALRAGSELAQANAELKAAQAAAARMQTLASEGIVAGARAEEATVRAAQVRAIAGERARLLSAAGGRGARPGEYVLRAPISGRVAQLNLSPGAGVEAMSAAAIVDRTDRLWVEARLPATLASRVAVGGRVDLEGVQGRIVAVGSAIDPRTRSVVMRAELPGAVAPMPGRTVTVTVFGVAQAGAQAIPRSAVTTVEGRSTVFLRTSKGFEPRTVAVVGQSAAQAVVTGLPPGAAVVVRGTSQLKSALAR